MIAAFTFAARSGGIVLLFAEGQTGYYPPETAKQLFERHNRFLLEPIPRIQGVISASITPCVIFLLPFSLISGFVLLDVAQQFDAQLAVRMNRNLGTVFTVFMAAVTDYGREYFWVLVVVVILIFGGRDAGILAIELSALSVVGVVAGGNSEVRAVPAALVPDGQHNSPPNTRRH